MSISADMPRRRGRWVIPLVLLVVLGRPLDSNGQSADSDGRFRQPEPEFEVISIPEIRFDTSKFAASPEQVQEIRALVEQLAGLALAPHSHRGWMSGGQFPRMPGLPWKGFAPIEKTPDQFDPGERLIRLGPKALGILVEALDDATPSKIEVDAAVGPKGSTMKRLDDKAPAHVVTRGDLCHAILGQITNRSQRAVTYAPKSGEQFAMEQLAQSPSADGQIVQELRDKWRGRDAARALFDSLMVDFHTRGQGSESLQCGAAVRLLYYFPEQSADIIASRLDGLDIGRITPWSGAVTEAWMRRYQANGVIPQELVAAVTLVPNPTVDRALVRLLERCDDPQIFHEAISASVVSSARETVYRRMREIIEVPPPEEQGAFGGEYLTLVKAVQYFPDRARPLLERYAAHGSLKCRWAAILALARPPEPVAWAAAFLRPWLDDTTPTLFQYGPGYDRRAIRLCDHAAQVLVEHVPGTKFELEGTHDDLDRQIELLRRFIAGDKTVVFGKAEPTPLEPASVDAREPIAVIEFPQSLGQVFDISDRETVYVGHGFQGDSGWAYETVWLSVANGSVLMRAPIDEWCGGVNIVRPTQGDSVFCYHGYEGGDIIQRDLRTGLMTRRIETPFQGDMRQRGPNLVRNLGDLAVSSDNAWIMAFTPDGGLHSIDVATGRHTREWQLDGEPRTPMGFHGKIIPMTGRNQFLISLMMHMDEPLRLWDQDKREMATLEKVPSFGWHSAWGPFAWNHLNASATIWDLDERRLIDLPGIEGITDVMSDGKATLFAGLADGSIVVIDLAPVSVVGRLAPPAGSEFTTMSLSRDRTLLFWVTGQRQTDESAGTSKIAIFDVADLMK